MSDFPSSDPGWPPGDCVGTGRVPVIESARARRPAGEGGRKARAWLAWHRWCAQGLHERSGRSRHPADTPAQDGWPDLHKRT